MENCLVTKLKSAVNNDNLEKLNVLKGYFMWKQSTASLSFYFGNSLSSSEKIYIDIYTEAGEAIEQKQVNAGSTESVSLGQKSLDTKYPFELKSKYNLSSISGIGINFNIDTIPVLPYITNISSSYNSSTGSIENLVKLTTLKNINFKGSKGINGEVLNLLKGMYENGRVSGDLSISAKESSIKFNNKTIGSLNLPGDSMYIDFNSTGCIVYKEQEKTNVIGTLANGEWTFPTA